VIVFFVAGFDLDFASFLGLSLASLSLFLAFCSNAAPRISPREAPESTDP